MSQDSKRLRRALRSLRRRAEAVRWVVVSGRYFLVLAILVLVFVLVRKYFLLTRDTEIVRITFFQLVTGALFAVLGLPLLFRLWRRVRQPALAVVARSVESATEKFDLLSSGLAAEGAAGPLAPAVVTRAARAAEAVGPERLYPARRSVAKTLAKLTFLLAAVYLLGLPAGAGLIPVPGGSGGGGLPTGNKVTAELPPREDRAGEAEDPEEDPPEAPEDAPDRIVARIVSAKKVYRADEPVVVYVSAAPGDPMRREHEVEAHVMVDDVVESLAERLRVRPEPGGGGHIATDLRGYRHLGPALTPGRHVLRAVLTEGDSAVVSEPVEIEIEGPPSGGGGGGGESEEPNESQTEQEQPSGGGGTTPPPEMDPEERFVLPLFRKGEEVKKKGWALVPDPDAPAGSPPRRLPLDAAVREASRRPESAVPTERLAPSDRKVVSRYFDLLRTGR